MGPSTLKYIRYCSFC